MGYPDAELIRRWQGGDPSAFEDLVRRWEQPVASFLARLVGRSEQVKDLCQEVFLKVYLARLRYRERGAFATWLYRIALNVARDANRRRHRAPESLQDREPPANGVPAETRYERQELAQAVTAALAELPSPLREVLVLRHYEDMSFEDMGRLLRTPASTLKSRFAVALNRIRRHLEQLGWNHEETS
jgi:RNA polymerase sigma-70 factor (ECF subfamily)